MLKVFIPFAHAKSVYEINNDFYKKLNIKYILVDLDNTLDSYLSLSPKKEAYELKDRLSTDNIRMIIVSNNRGKRVSEYANKLGVKFYNSIGKPFAFGINKLIKKENINKNEVILIGDQTSTDIPAGNRAHIKTVLTDKLVKEDQVTTRFNRIFDRPRRKRLEKKNLLHDWRNI